MMHQQIGLGKQECKICLKTFPFEAYLKVHMKRDHMKTNEEFTCNICHLKFKKQYQAKDHIKSKHLNQVLYYKKARPCKGCEKTFISASCLKNHIDAVHGSKRFQCDQCDNTYCYSTGLIYHRKHDHTLIEGGIPCKICEIRFETRHDLFVHEPIHKNEKGPYKCDICDMILKTKKTLENHTIRMHEEAKDPQKCTICQRDFIDKSALRQHVKRNHEEIRSFECTLCSKSFTRKDQLKSHVKRIHDVEKRKIHDCTLCKKQLFSIKTLHCHQFVKHGITRGKVSSDCPICCRKFFTKGDLNKHTKICMEESQKIECSNCRRKFKKIDHLQNHQKVCNEKIYTTECKACHLKFLNQMSLMKHIRKEHPEQVHILLAPENECSNCQRKLVTDSQFRKHQIACSKLVFTHQCGICKIKFTTPNGLEYHMKNKHL